MNPRMLRGLVPLLALAWPGLAVALDDADRAGIRSVIERQIQAFRRDDAEEAFGLASPAIQGMFGGKDAFMDMVRRGYAPVHRPRSFDFGPAREERGEIEQAVRIQDRDGADWDAVYALERQPDGSWRISGCRLVKRPGEAV